MCGFVGFVNKICDNGDVLNHMMKTIEHRGPDDSGKYIDKNVALGFRRLSILDLNLGNQPMFNEDGSLVLVFNGEIYNSGSLKEDLVKLNHKFSTNCDSEVLLHAYEEYGYEFIKKLRGMFAFVIYNKKNGKIFGARDFFGIKPFYYFKLGNDFIFGSEIKSFLKHPNFRKELNEEVLEQYLSFQYSPSNETFFQNVYKLPPAHYFIYENNELKIERYFEIKFEQRSDMLLNEWIEEIERIFDNSIKAHKIADVEVGSLLSSGVDSSYIACSAKVKKTFTVGFSNKKYNEIEYAKNLSEYIGAENYNKIIEADEIFEIFPKLQYHMDEPLADASALALYFVCKEASKQVKVVLSGEGADEIFGGYNVYKDPVDNYAFEKKIPFPIRSLIAKVALMFGPRHGVNFLVRRGTKLENRFIGNSNIFSEKERIKILKNPKFAKSPKEICKPFYNMVENEDDVTKMQFLDLNVWMVNDILLKADKMSMANSIELRVPFLDREIFEVARKLPLNFRVNNKSTKFALRQAALRRMPQNVANKKKLGFPVPIRVWLKQEKYYNEVLKKFKSPTCLEFFNVERLLQLLNNHKEGKHDNSRKILTVYTFLVWFEQFF